MLDLPLKDIRGLAATLCWPPLTICDTKWEPQKKTFPLWYGELVAGNTSSQQEGRAVVFCVEAAWMFAWIYSKDQQAKMIGGSELN